MSLCQELQKILTQVHVIYVPDVQQYLKRNRVSEGGNINFSSQVPLPVCFTALDAIFLSYLYKLI